MRKYQFYLGKCIHILFCIVLVCMVFAGNRNIAWAEEVGSITLTHAAPGAAFAIYKVGIIDANGAFSLVEPYSEYGVNINSSDAAKTLAAYVVRDDATSDKITPVASATAVAKDGEKEGTVVFTNLEKGVYLVIGDSIEIDGVRYTHSPVLVEIPLTEQNGDLVWDRLVEAKKEMTPVDKIHENLKVMKIWKSDDEAKRPKSVTVTLLRDGEEFEPEDNLLNEVELNADNNWTYEWEDLDPMYEWSVVEKEVPEGYVLSISTEQDVEVLTNVGKPGNPPDTPPGNDPPKKRLPKTGQDWNSVLMLVTAGLFFILVGLVMRRKAQKMSE